MGCVVRASAWLFNTKVYSKPQVKAEAVSGQDYGVRPEPSAPPYPADDDDWPFDDDDAGDGDDDDELPDPVSSRVPNIFVKEGSTIIVEAWCADAANTQNYALYFMV